MTYTFDPKTPPLMKNGQHALVTPASERQSAIGTAQWDEIKETVTEEFLDRRTVRRTQYTATRSLIWIAGETRTWAEDREFSTERTTGYDKETHQKLERTLEFGASAELPLAKLKAEVKGRLSITNEITEKWHIETTETITWKDRKGYTYCTWKLVDNFNIAKRYTEEYFVLGRLAGRSAVFEVPTIDAQCVLSYYEDSIEDANMEIFKRITEF